MAIGSGVPSPANFGITPDTPFGVPSIRPPAGATLLGGGAAPPAASPGGSGAAPPPIGPAQRIAPVAGNGTGAPPPVGPAQPIAPVAGPGVAPSPPAIGPAPTIPPITPNLAQQTMSQWGGPGFWGAITNALMPQDLATGVLPQLGVGFSPLGFNS